MDRTAAILFGSDSPPTSALPAADVIRPVSVSSSHVRPEPDGLCTAISELGPAVMSMFRNTHPHPRGPLTPNPAAVTAAPCGVLSTVLFLG